MHSIGGESFLGAVFTTEGISTCLNYLDIHRWHLSRAGALCAYDHALLPYILKYNQSIEDALPRLDTLAKPHEQISRIGSPTVKSQLTQWLVGFQHRKLHLADTKWIEKATMLKTYKFSMSLYQAIGRRHVCIHRYVKYRVMTQ